MDRLLTGNRVAMDKELLKAFYWLLRHESGIALLESILNLIPEGSRLSMNELEARVDDAYGFAETGWNLMRAVPKGMRNLVTTEARRLLQTRSREVTYQEGTGIQENVQVFQRALDLDDTETELCLFLLILYSYGDFGDLFRYHLDCQGFQARALLAVILDCKQTDISKALNGKLTQIGILDRKERGHFAMEEAFVLLLQDMNPADFRTAFFQQVSPDAIPLSSHVVNKNATKHMLRQLKYKPETSTHVVLYGPPGTGKTNYAYGVAKKLGLIVFLLEHGDKESDVQRRAAIAVCVNVAKGSNEALIIADDSDSILNTHDAWSLSGEKSNKRWLHEILETPGIRMIWIVNSIARMEESVARRFSFSLQFKPFTRQQRIQVWQKAVQTHKVRRSLTNDVIKELASRFNTSPGIIEQVVRKVKEAKDYSRLDFKSSVVLALESHIRLRNGGYSPKQERHIDNNFTLDGLNLPGTNINALLEELTGFNEYSKKTQQQTSAGMSLLFHGPPGTGKSAFARFIAAHLDREVVVKRASDLFSKWVGGTEQNIRDAYEEAQSAEAILVFDEADSLIFSRDCAKHSWEMSFTNEFLTWMESFEGIQIFTTNRLRALDNASLRRFTHKVEFGYLKSEGNEIFFEKFISPLLGEKPDRHTLLELRSWSSLTPGDFKAVRDKYLFRNKEKLSAKEILNALKEEARMKDMHAGIKNIGFA